MASTCPQFSPLRVEHSGCRDGVVWYTLTDPLRFQCGLNGGGLSVEVPTGFTTDFASIPAILWPAMPHDGLWAAASVVHDYLYQHGGCSRFLADAIFREAMAALGVPWSRRLAIYYAVRVFGWMCFHPRPRETVR